MWHVTLLWFLLGGTGYLPILQRLLDPAANFINEYTFGWSLLIGLHVVAFAALFAPSMRTQFSPNDQVGNQKNK